MFVKFVRCCKVLGMAIVLVNSVALLIFLWYIIHEKRKHISVPSAERMEGTEDAVEIELNTMTEGTALPECTNLSYQDAHKHDICVLRL